MSAPTMLNAASRIIQDHGPMTLDAFVGHIQIERAQARKLLANLVERDRIVFHGARYLGTYRVVEPGEIVAHPKARALKPEPSPLGVVRGAIQARPALATCWGGA